MFDSASSHYSFQQLISYLSNLYTQIQRMTSPDRGRRGSIIYSAKEISPPFRHVILNIFTLTSDEGEERENRNEVNYRRRHLLSILNQSIIKVALHEESELSDIISSFLFSTNVKDDGDFSSAYSVTSDCKLLSLDDFTTTTTTTTSLHDVIHQFDQISDYEFGVIITEKMNFDLLDFIQSNPTIHSKMEIFKDLCRSVDRLHQKDIAHLNLKLENIMLRSLNCFDHPPNVKIRDFSLAKLCKSSHQSGEFLLINDETMTSSNENEYSFGSLNYLPPECVERFSPLNDYYYNKVDVYSLGVILNVMITEKYPKITFELPSYSSNPHISSNDDDDDDDDISCIIIGEREYTSATSSSLLAAINGNAQILTACNDLSHIHQYFSADDSFQGDLCYDLLSKLLNDNPLLRPSPLEILSHPFFTTNFNSLNG